MSTKWLKYNIEDFNITDNGTPYVVSRLGTYGIRGQQPRVKKTFFPYKKVSETEIVIPKDVVDRLKYESLWKAEFPRAVNESVKFCSKEGLSVVESIENLSFLEGESIKDKIALISQAVSAENETIIMYQNMKEMFPEWANVLQDIIDEELKHVGQFNELMKLISFNVTEKISEGESEAVQQMKSQLVGG